MKITILQFSGTHEWETIIQNALIHADIRVKRVNSLSKLHIWAMTGMFDAILANSATIGQYRMNTTHHLWETQSHVTIITWTAEGQKTLTVATNTLPVSAPGKKPRANAEEKNAKILEVMSRINASQTECQDQANPLPREPSPLPAIGLHRKPADILRLLEHSGESGLSVERIRAAVWPGEKTNRKCDIQAYMSKLRKALNCACPGDYGIFRDRDRYILRKIGK